jgi:signal transduction histidine kinase
LVDISHELRTPLTVMRGRLEGILDGIYPADAEHIAPALEETYLLERLVDDLRLLALAETRQLHFELRRLDLGDLAARSAGLFQAQADEKEVKLEVNVQPGLPDVLADPQRTEQVIGNLLGNAVRYTNPGDRVQVQVQLTPAGVELAVSDNGPGVAESDLPHIFDRFWRGEKSRARASGGAGLGLAIARQLVEAQGGLISASNGSQGGLRVSFIFPAAPEN